MKLFSSLKPVFLLYACIACEPLLAAGQSKTLPLLLEPDRPVERELQTEQTHRYELRLTAGQFLKVEIRYNKFIGVISAYDPNHQLLVKTQNTLETASPKYIALIAAADGKYLIELEAKEPGPKVVRYRLITSQPHTATDADRHYALAQQMSDEAEKLFETATAESRRLAMAKFQASLPEWRAAKERGREAETLHSVATLKKMLGDNREALTVEQEALALARAVNDRQLETDALNGLGTIYSALSQFPQAMETWRQALRLCRELGDCETEVSLLNNLGAVSSTLGSSQQSLEYYLEALSLARQLGLRAREARLLTNIGVRYLNIGEPQKAAENFQQALAMTRPLGLRDDEAGMLHNLAGACFQLGEYQQALDYEKQSLALAQTTGYRRVEAGARVLLGQIYQRLGDLVSAQEHFQQGLALSRNAGFRNEEAMTLNSLGTLYKSRGDLPKALEHLEQALALHRTLGARANLPPDLIQLGAVRLAQEEIRPATEHFREAVALSHELGIQRFEVPALLHLAKAQRKLGEETQAAESLQRALELSRGINYAYVEAQALGELSMVYLAQKKYREAQTYVEQAIQLIESGRATIGSQELRASYREKSQVLYEAWIESLMQQGATNQFVARAFEACEQSRARSLVELLSESRVDLRQGIAPELRQREQELQQKLAFKSDRLSRMHASELNKEQALAFKSEIAGLIAEYDDVQTRIRLASPRFAALTAPEPLTIAEIQKQALDANTLLLEYSLGEQRSYLFAVTPSSIQSFTLPGRQEIETAARRFYRLTTEQDKPGVFRSAAESQQWAARNDRERAAATTTLSQMLLSPVAGLLGKKRLLIVGDGILHYVPFAALSDFGGKPSASQSLTPLIVNHEILTLPSASVLAALRRETTNREPARKTIAVLADPVFEETDERINGRKSGAPDNSRTEQNGVRGVTMNGDPDSAATFARLPFTRREAEAIVAQVPESDRKIALGFDANRALAVSPELATYRYLHFATHGLLNSEHPELSGLAFSLFDERGEKQNGFLRGLDVYNLRLSAELVVLSGCRTALGKEINGEGLMSMTRGFMYAGARRVLAGLWNVNDAATAELMRRFYREMLGKNRLAPAAALRAAQLSMRQEPRWRSPLYWAAFVLQGEW